MEGAAIARPRSALLRAHRSLDVGALCGWLLPVSLVSYLGVREGGYDVVISSQVGIATWWLLLLLLALRLVRTRFTTAGWVGFGLLAAYAAWTTLSLTWTESAESTMTDVSGMLLYVALLLLVLLVHGRNAIRYMLHGLAVGIVAIAVLALLSRLHFQWFAIPANALPGSTKRLSYPIEYWNALAALMAIGIPVLLYCATGARSVIARASAAACLPLLALCAFLTASRGGVIEIAVGVVLFVVLAPERLAKLAIIAVAGAGAALLIAAANQRVAVRDGLRTTLAAHQGNDLIAIAVAVAVGVGLLCAASVLVERHVVRPRLLAVSRRQLTRISAVGALIAIVAFAVAGGPSFLTAKWNQFKSPGDVATSSANAFSRLQSTAGEGRYQFWQVAAHAANGKPLTGTGANTFQFEWLQHGTVAGGFVIDAHSLYLQALGDLGYPGLLLISGFIAWILGCGLWRVVRSRDPARRLALAAATSAAFAFAFSAALDWIWFIPVLPVALFVCAGVIFAPDRSDADGEVADPAPDGATPVRAALRTPTARMALRVAGGITCIAAIVVIALPMSATQAVRASQAEVRANDLSAALTYANEAVEIQPYAAAGWLQEALVEERAGNLGAALSDAQQARQRQAVNWQIWLVLSRLQARTGHAAAALADYRHARWLNPNNL
ncbi:MAG: O-antigen ligase family protein [Solirubrobacteraceae bacterium]|jgi:O-antigen ligase